MPINTPFTAAPLPTSAEAGDGPANMLAYATATDDMHILKATSVSNRDTLYANVTAGTLVSCAALGTVWQKTTSPPTAAAWRTLSEIGTPVTSGVVTANTTAGFSVTAQWAQRLNGRIDLSVELAYSGTELVGAAAGTATPGALADVVLCTLQTGWLVKTGFARWPFAALIGATDGACHINTSGQSIYLSTIAPSGKLSPGNSVSLAVTYPAA